MFYARSGPAARAAIGAFLLAALLALIAIVVSVAGTNAIERTATTFMIAVAAVVGLGIFMGNSGIISFVHPGLMAIGAYTSGILTLSATTKPDFAPGLAELHRRGGVRAVSGSTNRSSCRRWSHRCHRPPASATASCQRGHLHGCVADHHSFRPDRSERDHPRRQHLLRRAEIRDLLERLGTRCSCCDSCASVPRLESGTRFACQPGRRACSARDWRPCRPRPLHSVRPQRCHRRRGGSALRTFRWCVFARSVLHRSCDDLPRDANRGRPANGHGGGRRGHCRDPADRGDPPR